MGIKGLTKLIQQTAEGSYKEGPMKSYFGRAVAMDATMFLYQFLIAIRYGEGGGNLTNDAGDTTSHINGFLYRTIRMMENGIKPIYIFDGKPPDFKAEELAKRREKREKAEQELKDAEETGDKDKVEQMQKRTVKVTKQHVKDVQDLLTFMGVPWYQAPGEAEAQASRMCAQGIVYGTGTEDMDALTFGTRRLVRHLTESEARKKPVLEFDLEKVLQGMDVTMDQFIDICILCGCDYCPSIRGIGPKRAVEFIKKYKNIENMVEKLKGNEKFKIPDDWEYKKARDLFKNPDVTNAEDLPKFEWKPPMEGELMSFLIDRMNFGMDRVKKAVERLKACKGKSAQRRLDSFFKVMPSPSNAGNNNKKKQMADDKKKNGKLAGKKRKRDEKNGNTNNGAPKNKKVKTQQ